MPTGDLVPGSDGHLAMTAGEWAKEKLHYIKRYCYIFNQAMKGKWGIRTYIDLFAGPGRCVIETTGEEIDGSPLIALRCEVPFTHYFFNDINADAKEALKRRTSSFIPANVAYFDKDCNEVIDEILQRLPSSSLDFCFIDPTNWQIKFDSIRRLTKDRRMDLAITFHTGAMKRVADRTPEVVDDYFDGPIWREEYKSMLQGSRHGKSRALLDIYEKRLKSLGYDEIHDLVLLKNTKGVPLYHLVFASKNPLGKDFWDKISQRSFAGQLRLSLAMAENPKVQKLSIRITTREYELLDGSKKELVQRVGDGSIITRFEKTPIPVKPTDVVCPHFLELKWATGCPFNCAWCYLKGTLRVNPWKTKPHYKKFEKIASHVRAFLDKVDWCDELLNTGELADSLMSEKNTNPFSKFIISLFQEQERHKVLFLTKSKNIDNLIELGHNGQAIISFSLNADVVAKRFEKGAPSVAERIEAASKLNDAGYEVRLRIDPIVPVPDWESGYKSLIDQIFSKFTPTRITLGSLRGLQSTINGASDKSWVQFLSEKSNWGRKVESKTRYEMYYRLIQYLKENYNYTDVALCKETLEIWNKLGMDYRKIKCNCIL